MSGLKYEAQVRETHETLQVGLREVKDASGPHGPVITHITSTVTSITG